jgi:hypothetical protein
VKTTLLGLSAIWAEWSECTDDTGLSARMTQCKCVQVRLSLSKLAHPLLRWIFDIRVQISKSAHPHRMVSAFSVIMLCARIECFFACFTSLTKRSRTLCVLHFGPLSSTPGLRAGCAGVGAVRWALARPRRKGPRGPANPPAPPACAQREGGACGRSGRDGL